MSFKIAITSIQRDRGPYILEWIAFHLAQGVEKFYIYNHGDDPVQLKILHILSERLPHVFFVYSVGHVDRPQILAYQHAWDTHKYECDAMAFIDGDEFLFSPSEALPSVVAELFQNKCSALGVYWTIYGSSGHYEDPQGLIIEKYTRHSSPDFFENKHIKTIMRGGSEALIQHSHWFETPLGTIDEKNRALTGPIAYQFKPSSERLRLNHYTTQSFEFYLNKKRISGQADLMNDAQFERGVEWFHKFDRNEIDDGVIYGKIILTKIKLKQLQNLLLA